MRRLRFVARIEPVLVATKVCVVALFVFRVGLAEVALTVTVSVGPLPPCGGAPGVVVFRTGVVPLTAPATPPAGVAVPVKLAVALIEFDWICTRKLTLTVAPAARAPTVQVTVVAVVLPGVQVP